MANLEKIKDIAKARGIPLDNIAKELDITPQALSKMMRENSTRITTLEKIAQILKVSISVFFEEESDVRLALAEQNGMAIIGDANNIIKENERLIERLAQRDAQIDRLLAKIDEKEDEIKSLRDEIKALTDKLIAR